MSFERFFAFMTKPQVVVTYIGLVLLSMLYWDQPIAYFLQGLHLKTLLPFLNWFTHLGMSFLYIGPLFLAALYSRVCSPHKKWEGHVWFLGLCVLIPSLICLILKVLLGRARPELLFSEHLYGFFGFHVKSVFWSCPSGHTTTVFGLVFGLCILFPRYFYGFLILGLFVVSTRVLLTYHYLSDVLISMYLTLLEVGVLFFWLRSKKLGVTDK